MRPIHTERPNLLTEGSLHFSGTIHTYGAFTLTEIETLWLHSIMQNMFPLAQIQIRISFP